MNKPKRYRFRGRRVTPEGRGDRCTRATRTLFPLSEGWYRLYRQDSKTSCSLPDWHNPTSPETISPFPRQQEVLPVSQNPIQWQAIESLPFAENCYVLYRCDGSDCVLVDPGTEPDKILTFLEKHRLTPEAVLNTHGHADHIAGNAVIKQRWPQTPLLIGRLDAPKLTDPQANLSAPFGLPLISPPADRVLDHGETVRLKTLELEVFHTPGHSRGHVVFLCRETDPWFVLGGDVLFAGGIGRFDFPDSNQQDLFRSIREVMFTWPDETLVLPGHGPPTTIGQEKRFNPFVGQTAQP